MAGSSGDYLSEIGELLWPSPAGYRLLVLPHGRRPRIVVPAGRRAGAAALRRYGVPGSVRTRLATRTLATLLASGLGRFAGHSIAAGGPPGGQTIESYLATLLRRPVQVSMHLGAARANRKPVLQLLSQDGETIGYAKIGVDTLTAGLVRAERLTLTALASAGLELMRVPRVLAHGCWNGLEVLVLSPLPVWLRRRPLRSWQLRAALAELSKHGGISSATLPGSQYLDQLASRLGLVAGSQEKDRLSSALGRLAETSNGTALIFGSWHGDLTPWNLARTSAGLLVWDWERFGTGVPVGFDALHYWLAARVVRAEADPARSARQCVERATSLLGPFGIGPAAARLTALAYLAELSVRYLADRQEQTGARLGAPRRWLLPALEAGLRGGTSDG
jgi:hypothetical protein